MTAALLSQCEAVLGEFLFNHDQGISHNVKPLRELLAAIDAHRAQGRFADRPEKTLDKARDIIFSLSPVIGQRNDSDEVTLSGKQASDVTTVCRAYLAEYDALERYGIPPQQAPLPAGWANDRATVEKLITALEQHSHISWAEGMEAGAAMLRALLVERDAALERAEKAEQEIVRMRENWNSSQWTYDEANSFLRTNAELKVEVARLRRAVERKNATLHTLRAVREDFCKPEWIEPIGNRLRESIAYTGNDTHEGEK